MKKIPMRRCISCGESKCKKDLFRIVKCNDSACFDNTGKISGRGTYICSLNCLKKAIKSKKIEKEFDIVLSSEDYDKLISDINNGGVDIG